MTPPDWRALVAECGADPGRVDVSRRSPMVCTLYSGEKAAGFTAFPDGRTYWRVVNGGGARAHEPPPETTPAEAIRAALTYLRAELRARIERDRAALQRLGGGE